jgi:hypothetical protein
MKNNFSNNFGEIKGLSKDEIQNILKNYIKSKKLNQFRNGNKIKIK